MLLLTFFSSNVLAQSEEQAVPAAGHPVLEEVVVTAQRRMEPIQDVPISITSASGPQLAEARVDNIATLRLISPSVGFQSSNNAFASPNIQIRGVGTVGNSRTFEGAVGVFVDGVYRSRAGQALQDWLDIDQVQILRGPQGTLFGAQHVSGCNFDNQRRA